MKEPTIFYEYNDILNLAKKYCISRKEMLEFLENAGIDISMSPIDIYEQKEELCSLFTKIIGKHNGILEKLKENEYKIYFDKYKLNILLSFDNDFEYETILDGVPYFTGYENDYFTFISILCNPESINEFDFHYNVSINDENHRFLDKNDAIAIFNTETKNSFSNENILKYHFDKNKVYGIYESDKHNIKLENLFEIDNTKFKCAKNFMDLVISLDFDNLDDYEKLGFTFSFNDNRNIIQIIKKIAEKNMYIINRISSKQITISQKDNVQFTITCSNLFNIHHTPFLELPFSLKVESINNGRIGLLHNSLLNKRMEPSCYEDNIYSLQQILNIIENKNNNLIEHSYVVLYGGQAEDIEKTTIYYDTFEDALYMPNGFLDIIKDFEKIELDTTKKFGVAYSSFEPNGTPKNYCAITKSNKIAEFYANIIRMLNL